MSADNSLPSHQTLNGYMNLSDALRKEIARAAQYETNVNVVCVDNFSTIVSKELTIGKEYKILGNSSWPLIHVINDKGQEEMYGSYRFELAKKTTIPPALVTIMTNNVALQLNMKANIINIGSNYLWVRFISDRFINYKPEQRDDLVMGAYHVWAPLVISQYELLVETFTPIELAIAGDLS